ncbi:CRTAC1 family protein [Pseudoalteromonas sp. XMcav1-K]|uniref:CRTAC1 family protein n=1 Tax=Pseudoalteromonas sp. XMcav1-K TaxID=3374372 RepID=UPI00375767F8
MFLLKPIYFFAIVWVLIHSQAVLASSNNSLKTILNAINELEKKSEPKCYATASRLEDFMFGTPLSDKARFAKNMLQKEYIEILWQHAHVLAEAESEQVVLKSHILEAQKQFFLVNQDKNQHWRITFSGDNSVTLHKDDKRQYGSIAYSLRAVLAVQQDALLDFDNQLLPLTARAVDAMKNSLDFYTLAALKVADNTARINNQAEIELEVINSIWRELGVREKPVQKQNGSIKYAKRSPTLLNAMVEKKLSSYSAYNQVSNQVFLRNLQVYFARTSWPSNKSDSDAIINLYAEIISEFASDLYLGAQQLAMENKQSLVQESDVYEFANQFIPHKINEYEDALFFPKLGNKGMVYIESYDMDAFRDAGAHWHYLKTAINKPEFDLYIEPDPFAAELLTENIAQYGVLLLREAGSIAKQDNAANLNVAHLSRAKQLIIDKTKQHTNALVSNNYEQPLASAEHSIKSATFSNVSKQAKFDYEHRSSDWLNRQLRTFLRRDKSTGVITIPPAFGGSGVAAEDINNDGLIDIFILGGRGNKLFLNMGDAQFNDVTERYKLNWSRKQDNHPGEARQPIVADINNDGWQDIIVTYVNDTHRVYQNIKGQYFKDVTEIAQLGGQGLVGGPATVFDYDRDGDLDLYITYFGNYITGDLPTLKRRNTNGKPNQLYENIGNFKFKNVTKGSGLDNTGWAQAVAHTDLNNDGWQDVIVGNDFGVNGYYINQKNGTFIDVSSKIGTDKPSYTMGIGIADLNQDSLPDIYISNIVTMNKDETYVLPNEDTQMKFDAEKLAHMRVIEANDLFMSSKSDGLSYQPSERVGRGYSSTGWSWDADFFDYDLDGDDDLYVLNGMNEFNLYSSKNPYFEDQHGNKQKALLPVSEKELNIFFENKDGHLQTMDSSLGLNLLSNSRSASYFDLENDGDLDIVLNNYHEPAALFQNNLKTSSGWLKVKLLGAPQKNVTKDAIGARIYLTLPNGHNIWREVRSTDGYMSVHPKVQHFGLGNAKSVKLKVVWPNGETSTIENVKPNQLKVIEL